jgi:hypothetical protein
LVREIRAKSDAPVWHENEDGRFALKITRAGREAIMMVGGGRIPLELLSISEGTRGAGSGTVFFINSEVRTARGKFRGAEPRRRRGNRDRLEPDYGKIRA